MVPAMASESSPAGAALPPTRLPEPGDPDALYLFDISAFIFRAYHALPPLSNSKGEPTGAVAGVAQMLFRFFEERKPVRVAVAFDAPGPSLRKQRYPDYKANRPPAPPDLKEQIVRVRQLVEAWGLLGLEAPGYEADDVIATVVRGANDLGLRTVILSGDKDLLQLVGPSVSMYDPMRERVFGAAETVEKMGVPPKQVRDLLALMGDSSDNVPGVPKVGAKTAAKLLGQYGSFDAIYAHVDEVKGKLGERLREHRAQAELSRELVTLFDEVPVDFKEEQLRRVEPDVDALAPLLRELELTRLEARLKRGRAQAPSEVAVELVRDSEALASWMGRAREAGRVGLYVTVADESPLRSSPVGVALVVEAERACYVPFGHRALDSGLQLAGDELEPLRVLLADEAVEKYCASLEHDTLALARAGFELRGVTFDVSLASYLLASERRAHDLVTVASTELGRQLPERQALESPKRGVHHTFDELAPDQVAEFAGAQAAAAFALGRTLSPRFESGELGELLRELELPLARILVDLELRGVRLDLEAFACMSDEVQASIAREEGRAHELAGASFNVSSPRALEAVLYDELGLPVLKKTKTARSTSADVLEDLLVHPDVTAESAALIEAVLEYRSLSKLFGTYLSALPKLVDADTGRLRTRYNQAVAATGRLSSSEPNLQNIPIRTELGRRIREAFVPESGWKMLAADYSQVELRVLAHLSADEALVDAYTRGADVHARTAEAIFGVDAGDVSREQRAAAKTVNFAVIYGQSEYALGRNLRIPRAEARRYIAAFFERYAGVARYMDEIVEGARERGYVTTLFGRRRTIPDLRSRNRNLRAAAERVARNTPIQGTAADILKRAMVRVEGALKSRGLAARMLLTVHDELVFELPPEEEEALTGVVREAMAGAAELSVPLEVGIGVGANWGEAH